MERQGTMTTSLSSDSNEMDWQSCWVSAGERVVVEESEPSQNRGHRKLEEHLGVESLRPGTHGQACGPMGLRCLCLGALCA